MTAVHEILAADLAGILSGDGVAMTFTAASDGATTAIAAALFSETPPEVRQRRDGQDQARAATCILAAADVAAPARGDSLTVRTEAWSIVDLRPVGAGEYWRLTLRHVDVLDRTRQGFRR